jgi:serine/threonine protein kinase
VVAAAALKSCRKDRIHALEQRSHILSEKACMERLIADGPHPFVTTLVQTFRLRDRLCFLLQLVQGGELFTLLKKKVRLSDSEARFYAANLALFLEAAHARSVVYRDVKPENLLLDDLGYLVAADFGFAKQVSRHSARTFTLCG